MCKKIIQVTLFMSQTQRERYIRRINITVNGSAKVVSKDELLNNLILPKRVLVMKWQTAKLKRRCASRIG